MGIHNVAGAYGNWAHLPHLPFRVLVWMAYRSMDGDRPPRYWGGWEELAFAAGRMPPLRDDDDKDATRQRKAAYNAIARVIATLVAAGAVKASNRAAPGHNAEYALNLFTLSNHAQRGTSPVDNSADASRRTTLSETDVPHSPSRRTTLSVSTYPSHRGTEEKQEKQENNSGDIGGSERNSPPRAREPVDNPEDRSDKTDQCPACGVLYDPGRVCGNRRCNRYRRTR